MKTSKTPDTSQWDKPQWLYATFVKLSEARNGETLLHLTDIRDLRRNVVLQEKIMYLTKEYRALELEPGDLLEVKCYYHKIEKQFNLKYPHTLRNRSRSERLG